MRECHGSLANLARLEQVDRFSQYLAQIGAVDLVNNKQERLIASLLACVHQPTWLHKDALTVSGGGIWCESHHEILIRSRGMELDDEPPASELSLQCLLRETSLASTRRALQHNEVSRLQPVSNEFGVDPREKVLPQQVKELVSLSLVCD
jgi:hypothetical protein